MFNKSLIILLVLAVTSCNIFRDEDERIPIARVGDNYLYNEDLKDVLLNGLSKEDSSLVVQNFITKWATQQLLVDGAKLNLSAHKQYGFDKLVVQYKNDLYSKAYLEALVNKNLDTVVKQEDAKIYY